MRFLLVVLFSFGVLPLFAQPNLTVDEIARQTRFIAAKQTALLGKTAEAVAQYKALLEEAPQMDAALFELGRLYFAQEENDAAIDALVRAYTLRPNEVYATFLGELYEASGRYREGAALYAGMRKQNPEVVENYLAQADFLTRAQDVKAAVKVYDALEERIGVNLELARNKHALYLASGDKKRAEKELTALVESDPANLQFRHMLAGYYTSQNNQSAAKKVYREILRRQPDDVRAQLALQDAAPVKTSGDDAGLLAMLGDASVNIDLKIGRLLPLVQELARTQDAGLGERAVRLTAELQRVHPDEAKATAMLGDAYFHSGKLTEAATAYRNTLQLDDTVYPVWEQLLATLYLDNQTVALRKYAEEALDIYPNRPAVYVHYAIGEALRANFSEASSLLQEAQLMTSGQPEAAAQLQALEKALEQLSGAGSAAADLKLLPGGAQGPLAFLLTKDDDAAALTAYDTPGNTNALFLEALGDALAGAGDEAAATKAYARAKAAGSKSGSLRGKLLGQ